MSKISVTTVAGLTSGANANKVIVESGDSLEIPSGNLTVSNGTSTLNGNVVSNGTITEMKVSTDSGSSSDTVTTAYESSIGDTNVANVSLSAAALVNVTNISTFQFFIKTVSIEDASSLIHGGTNENQAMIIFERKGPAQ